VYVYYVFNPGKRKYHRGRRVRTRWVFGGIERSTRKCFLEVVPNRNAQTLLPIIRKWISNGTHIISDGWQSYTDIPLIDNGVYTHSVIIHQQNFVNDADDSIHTQNIESLWKRVKSLLKGHGRMSEELLESYLAEAMWRESINGQTVFCSLLKLLRTQYVV
jgi:transposase-like protein